MSAPVPRPRKHRCLLRDIITARVYGSKLASVPFPDTAMASIRCSTVVTFPGDKVYGMEFSPSGGLLVTTLADRACVGVDVKSGKQIFKLEHEGAVNVVRFWDSNRITTGSDDTHARVWDLRMLACSHVLRGHLHWVKNAEPVNDHTLVTAGFDGTVRLWDTRQQYCKPLDMEAPVPLTLLGYYDDLGPEYVHDNCLFASPSLRRIAYYNPTSAMNESRLIIAIKGRLLSIANLDFTTLATALSDDIPTVDEPALPTHVNRVTPILSPLGYNTFSMHFNNTGTLLVGRGRLLDNRLSRFELTSLYDLSDEPEGKRLRERNGSETVVSSSSKGAVTVGTGSDGAKPVSGYPDVDPDRLLMILHDTNTEVNVIKVPAMSPDGAFIGSPYSSGLRMFSTQRILDAYRDAGGATVTTGGKAMIAEALDVSVAGATPNNLNEGRVLPASNPTGVQLCCAFSPTAPILATGCNRGTIKMYKPV